MMRLTNLHMNEFNSIQFAIILNFIFLLIPAIFLIYYVYSLGIYLNEIYFLICYFYISKISNLIISVLSLSAFYKNLIHFRRHNYA